MTTLKFQDFCDDILNQSTGLMSDAQLSAARQAYRAWIAPKKSESAKTEHPDMKKSLAELRSRCERLVKGQQYDVSKFESCQGYESAIAAGKSAIAAGQAALAGKGKKSDFIAHAEMNSLASRLFNAAKS